MDQRTYSAAWLSLWREEITAALCTMTSAFEETHGYAPGTNEVRSADAAARRATRGYVRELTGFDDLLTFYQSISEVVLEDIGNGYFIHSAHDVLRQLTEDGAVSITHSSDPYGIVIASDGGGIQFVADRSGAIHRSRAASLDDVEFDKVADDLPQFLDLIRRSVLRFVRTGDPGYL